MTKPAEIYACLYAKEFPHRHYSACDPSYGINHVWSWRANRPCNRYVHSHPSLEPVLKRTLGVPLFQEQLLRIAMTVADFSGAEADELRRAVGMRRSWERMKNLEGKLRAGMARKGIDTKTQDTIVQHISSFALYGFPESHAATCAMKAPASFQSFVIVSILNIAFPDLYFCRLPLHRVVAFAKFG